MASWLIEPISLTFIDCLLPGGQLAHTPFVAYKCIITSIHYFCGYSILKVFTEAWRNSLSLIIYTSHSFGGWTCWKPYKLVLWTESVERKSQHLWSKAVTFTFSPRGEKRRGWHLREEPMLQRPRVFLESLNCQLCDSRQCNYLSSILSPPPTLIGE